MTKKLPLLRTTHAQATQAVTSLLRKTTGSISNIQKKARSNNPAIRTKHYPTFSSKVTIRSGRLVEQCLSIENKCFPPV